jgi:hypothetical protein
MLPGLALSGGTSEATSGPITQNTGINFGAGNLDSGNYIYEPASEPGIPNLADYLGAGATTQTTTQLPGPEKWYYIVGIIAAIATAIYYIKKK